jgi:hypothetical protein
MATTTKSAKKFSPRTIVKAEVAILFLLLVAVGFFFGRITAPVKVDTVTVTELVEVPAPSTEELPEAVEISYYDVPLSHSLQDFIYEMCAEEHVPMSLIIAMIDHESKFNPEAVSATNDYGLMQINEVNHDRLEEQYQCADMFNPYQNVFCGIKVIGSYIATYEDYTKALMAYNMGNYGAKKAWTNGITSTAYTDLILGLMQEYENGR